jgi:hypothetical protein
MRMRPLLIRSAVNRKNTVGDNWGEEQVIRYDPIRRFRSLSARSCAAAFMGDIGGSCHAMRPLASSNVKVRALRVQFSSEGVEKRLHFTRDAYIMQISIATVAMAMTSLILAHHLLG